MKPPRILHILSQQPGYTGSGIFFDALIRKTAIAKIPQCVVFGATPSIASTIELAVEPINIYPVLFETSDMPFPIAGMSEVMPYRSSSFSSFDHEKLTIYLSSFRRILLEAVETFRPTVLWTHHIWLISALARELFPNLPQLTFSHGTELLQIERAPILARYVFNYCQSIDTILALSQDQKNKIIRAFNVAPEKVIVTGGGVRDDIFTLPDGPVSNSPVEIVYIGKLSNIKGVPYLLEAINKVVVKNKKVRFTLVGDGHGTEAELIRAKCASMKPYVRLLGALPHEKVANLLKNAHILVLPSFNEGLGLVVLEALSCGCRIVVNKNPSLIDILPNNVFSSGMVRCISLPRMYNQQPIQSDIPKFVNELSEGLLNQIDNISFDDWDTRIAISSIGKQFSWSSIFSKVKEISELLISNQTT